MRRCATCVGRITVIAGNTWRLTFRGAPRSDDPAGLFNIVALALELVCVFFAIRVVKTIGGYQAMAADRSLSAVFA